MRVAEPEEGKG
jgi:hypothetical protein